jgi:hypothetical protein
VRACNNAELPGVRKPFLLDGQAVGWLSPAVALALEGVPGIRATANRVELDDPAALPGLARDLADRGLFRWRGEAFDVRATADGPVLAQIDRGAIPSFGVQARGVHVNGLVHRRDGLHLWVARRAMDKMLDPGKLDHLVAGGVPAGLGPKETLIKEAGEEASLPPDLAALAVPASILDYAMERPEGLRRDRLYCFDLTVPEDFTPQAADGEVEAFELWSIARVIETVRATDDFKFNVNLVLIDLFLRLKLIAGSEAEDSQAALDRFVRIIPAAS